MKNRKGNLLMTLGLVLILAALALVGYNQWDASRAQQESDDALMALEQIRIQRQMESQQTAAPPVVTATMMPTDTPATDAPITDAPTADAPATDTPAASTPSVTDALTTDIPRDDATATNTPVTDAPATANPATNPPKPTSAPTTGTATNQPKPTNAPTAGTATNQPKPTNAPTAGTATNQPKPTNTPTAGDATNPPKPTSAPTAGTATNPPKPTNTPTAGNATNPPKPTNTPTAGTATNPPKPTSTPDAAQTSNPTSTPEITETPMPTETPEPTPSPEPTPTPTPAPTGKLYERVPGIEMPGEKVNGHEYIGTLSIPSLGLKVPVQRNWSYENLSVSPCRYSGSAYAGNLAIIAHTYHFGKLSSLALDATVTFTDMENNVFRYVVREKNTISPNDANEIAHSGYDLTLVTCTISGTKRVAVYCERVK